MPAQRPRKQFGQNFLHDRNIIDKIIAAIDPHPEDAFVEIGPGRGALTRPLLERAGRLDVIEIDHDLAESLAAEILDPRFTLHRADALKFNFATIARPGRTLRVAGNLPYNISSPLLFHLLERMDLFEDIHVMLQKEVVSRMVAEPGSKAYGRLSVALAARCEVEALFNIRPGSFTPAPRVDSTFVRLRPDAARWSRVKEPSAFDSVVRNAFGMRRKRLSNALQGLLSEDQIAALGIDPGLRAEQLPVGDFVALANQYASLS